MDDNVKIKDIINCIEAVAPLQWQEDYDNAGLIVGNKENNCSGVLICLDVFTGTLEQAIQKNCNLIISHHPFIFRGIKKLLYGSQTERILTLALKNDIAIYASHTNMDSAFCGVNSVLAETLGLQNISPLDNSKFPENENYLGVGAIGMLQQKTQAKDFLSFVKKQLNLPAIRFIGNLEQDIQKVGLCGGAGSFLTQTAIKNNCDIFLTGDLKYHDFLSYEDDIILADIGHFESEQFIKQRFFDIISKKMCNFAPLYFAEEKNRVKFL